MPESAQEQTPAKATYVVTKDGFVISASDCRVVALSEQDLNAFLGSTAPEHRYAVAQANGARPMLRLIQESPCVCSESPEAWRRCPVPQHDHTQWTEHGWNCPASCSHPDAVKAHRGEHVADNGIWLTAGEVVQHLSQFPPDMPVTILTPDGGGWYNTPGMSDPRDTDESSVIFYTSDDFDTRQW